MLRVNFPRQGAVMAKSVLPYVTAGVAIAGAGFWLATSPDQPAPATAAPAIQLASLESPLAPPPTGPALCPMDPTACGATSLFGPGVSPPTPNALKSALPIGGFAPLMSPAQTPTD